MNTLLKSIIYSRFFIHFAYYFIRLYSATFRLKIVNEDQWKSLVESGKTVLLCAWHQQFFSVIRHFKTYSKYNPGLMISKSRDGELIAGVANKTGWHTARGSSSRGGRQALTQMIRHLNIHGLGAHLIDGPTGPMGVVKAGAVKIAQETGAAVVPFYTYSENAWFFNSWDRFMLPRPFSTVHLTFGDELYFEKEGSLEGFEAQRKHLENLMLPYLHHKR
ncbi:MAG: lysophospholipid acyltransferase family protein [Proteobacteria bacterium]|nr:lysophospholipid acyltransferase family protein [Pseudomonadota bacterium]MBU1389086.1 lysophospholipid acyltransferase family protein [Pseudomonadota bacterium]MBU1543639.1 lysophospholipid acyltransferase family protein [Pseudomonadota bacterium]MBU2429781.1 lysophospholipid acyltransferase family protein [Pseudomonadota bacterium]MBU2479843.1 lysophospholipid acyltransferase family protein [Pseudomonadota bacterium]